ncbi:MAG: hypothetical protein INR71_02275 [Terriglobus roseus]|nr:hypothetical protein [Terriglobus roseus]
MYHRTLPVLDVEVLAPRHLAPGPNGALVELPADRLPGWGSKEYQRAEQRAVAEALIKAGERLAARLGEDEFVDVPRGFTAKEFARGEGESMAWVGEDGVERTETTWIHHPVLEKLDPHAGPSVSVVF